MDSGEGPLGSETGDAWLEPFVLEGEDPYRFAAPTLGILGELAPAITAITGASHGRDPRDEFFSRFGATITRDPEAGRELGEFPGEEATADQAFTEEGNRLRTLIVDPILQRIGAPKMTEKKRGLVK